MSVARTPRRVSVVGCEIDALTLRETLDAVDGLIGAGVPVQHCVINASKAVLMDRDPGLRAIVTSCGLVNADGQSVVWASRLLGRPLPERVAGIDLFQYLLGLAEERGHGVYFLGAAADVVQATVARARRDHPRLQVAGSRDGYWDDDDEVIAGIRDARPQILFVALPSPRKEYWLAANLEALQVPFCMGVGGSFDVYAGKTRRAPGWMQAAGLEWAYRFYQDPAHMWRRYLFGNLAFLRLVMREYRRDRGARVDPASHRARDEEAGREP